MSQGLRPRSRLSLRLSREAYRVLSYVDECQDLFLIDTLGTFIFTMFLRLLCGIDRSLVLRIICQNRSGLFWAGDTAQTISLGSAFRFDDLTAFHYRIEVSPDAQCLLIVEH